MASSHCSAGLADREENESLIVAALLLLKRLILPSEETDTVSVGSSSCTNHITHFAGRPITLMGVSPRGKMGQGEKRFLPTVVKRREITGAVYSESLLLFC